MKCSKKSKFWEILVLQDVPGGIVKGIMVSFSLGHLHCICLTC